MKTPVLIIGYLRPDNLELLLRGLLSQNRKVFVFIDKAADVDRETNDLVFEVANSFIEELDIQIFHSKNRHGARMAVPIAIDWAMTFSDELIIFEDDCLPNDFAYNYFDMTIPSLNNRILLVSSRSPNEFLGSTAILHLESLIVTSFALTNGWATNKQCWDVLRKSIYKKINFFYILKAMWLRPNKILAISFFYAAYFQFIHKKSNAGWDAAVVLNLLLINAFSISPNITCVANIGIDSVASNTLIVEKGASNILFGFGTKAPSSNIDYAKKTTRRVDAHVMKNLYGISARNLFSPLKVVALYLLRI